MTDLRELLKGIGNSHNSGNKLIIRNQEALNMLEWSPSLKIMPSKKEEKTTDIRATVLLAASKL